MSKAPLPSSFDDNEDFYEEKRLQKLFRRLKEEPLVPLGCALTCYALYRAGSSVRSGDHATANRMFRARIYAQGFTLAAIVAGSFYWETERAKRKEFEGVIAEKKGQEKREAWIKELEARDLEEKEAEARRQAIRTAKQADRKKAAEQPKPAQKPADSGAKDVSEGSEQKGEGGIVGAVTNLLQGKK